MTAAAVELCGHRWAGPLCIPPDVRPVTGPVGVRHECDEPADHPPPCRCRCGCGTTTTRERTNHA